MIIIEPFVDSLQKIIRDTNLRLEKASLGDDESLRGGIWYGAEYYRVLQANQKRKHIVQLVSKGAFFHGYAQESVVYSPSDTKSPTGQEVLSFFLKKKVKPSFAIEKIEEGLSFLDCSTVIMLSAYKALCECLGKDKFDFLFSVDSPFSFRLTMKDSSPLKKLLFKHKIMQEKEVQRGDICYFSNIHEYVAKHPAGESRGDHLVCLSEDPHLYIGFGLTNLGLDRRTIEYQLWDCYNREPLDEGCFNKPIWDYLYSHYCNGDIKKGKALVESFREKKISWKEFNEKPPRAQVLGESCMGKMGLWVYRFDLKRIEQLVSSDKKNLIEVFSLF